MSPRMKWTLLGSALAFAAWLAVFGDKTAEGDGAPAEAVSPRAATGQREPDESNPAEANISPPPRWQARNAQATAAWLAQPVDLFRSLTPAVNALPVDPPSAVPSAAPVRVIGRSLSPGARTVYLQSSAEPQSEVVLARVGSVVNGFQVIAIEAEAVMLRHRESGHVISLPMGGPYGVFDVGATHATQQ